MVFFFSSRRRHTRSDRDWSSDVCSSDLVPRGGVRIARRTVDLDGRLHGRRGGGPVRRGDGRERVIEFRPLEKIRISKAAQQRDQLRQYASERADIAEAEVDGLEP